MTITYIAMMREFSELKLRGNQTSTYNVTSDPKAESLQGLRYCREL